MLLGSTREGYAVSDNGETSAIANQRHQPATQAEAKFQALLELAPDAIVITDQAGRITIANGQAEAIFGYHRDELIGRPIEILMPERFRLRHVHHRTGYVGDPHTRPMGSRLDLVARRKDGSEFPVEI